MSDTLMGALFVLAWFVAAAFLVFTPPVVRRIRARRARRGYPREVPYLPPDYRYRVYQYAGEILTVRIEERKRQVGSGDLVWVDTHHSEAVGGKSPEAVRATMTILAERLQRELDASPLCKVYNPGDTIG